MLPGKLWKYGKKAPDVLREQVLHIDLGIANEEDDRLSPGISVQNKADESPVAQGELQRDRYEAQNAYGE